MGDSQRVYALGLADNPGFHTCPSDRGNSVGKKLRGLTRLRLIIRPAEANSNAFSSRVRVKPDRAQDMRGLRDS
jgi:hypothetical protein